MILTRIRNCYSSIRLLTLECLSGNDPDGIPILLQNREQIMGLISSEEQKISGEPFDAASLATLRDEIDLVVGSIALLDRQLETVIRGRLDSISGEMGKLYRRSRAASAYTGQSTR